MSNTKILHEVFAAWEYDREVEEINKRSQEGWQLIHGGCFYSKYKEDHSIVYRYQLDYQLHIDDKLRYLETFREQGWEYINSTFNGWHFFRKRYDPALDESEYEIYTDIPSAQEMANRWLRMFAPCAVVAMFMFLLALTRMIQAPELSRLGMMLEFAVLFALAATAFGKARNIEKPRNKREKKFSVFTYFMLAVLGLVFYVVVSDVKGNVHSDFKNSAFVENNGWSSDLNVHIPDFYYLTAECDSEIPVTVTLTGEDGKVIYEKTGDQFKVKTQRLFLGRGAYQLNYEPATEEYEGKQVNLKVEVN